MPGRHIHLDSTSTVVLPSRALLYCSSTSPSAWQRSNLRRPSVCTSSAPVPLRPCLPLQAGPVAKGVLPVRPKGVKKYAGKVVGVGGPLGWTFFMSQMWRPPTVYVGDRLMFAGKGHSVWLFRDQGSVRTPAASRMLWSSIRVLWISHSRHLPSPGPASSTTAATLCLTASPAVKSWPCVVLPGTYSTISTPALTTLLCPRVSPSRKLQRLPAGISTGVLVHAFLHALSCVPQDPTRSCVCTKMVCSQRCNHAAFVCLLQLPAERTPVGHAAFLPPASTGFPA